MRSVFIDVLPKSNEFRNITMNMEGRSEKFLAYRKLGKDGGVIHLWKNFHNDGSMAWAEKSTLSTTGKLKTFVREAVGLDLTEAAGHIRRVAKKSIDGNSPERDIADALLSSDDIEYSNDETEAIMDNTLINFGGEIKSVEETETGYRFGGWLVVFDKPDVSGLRDRFTKSTDFDIEDGDRRSLYYNHGLDGTIKKEKLGDCHVSIKDAGVWISGELKKRSDYLAKHVQHIAENIKQFGLSSGAPAHLVERVKVDGGHEIKKWVLSEASITPTPAEPMTFCTSLKSLVEMEGDGDLFDDEMKGYNARQPRDDHGRWDDGAGGISQGHAAHVMRSEGISDKDAAGVLGKIKDGTHKTREDVLKHIDSIHATNGGAAAGEGAAAVSSTQTALHQRLVSAGQLSQSAETGQWNFLGVYTGKTPQSVVAAARANGWKEAVGITDTAKRAIGRQQDAAALAEEAEKHGVAITKVEFNGLVRRNQSAFDSVQAKIDKAKARKSIESNRGEETENGLNAQEITKRHLPFDADQFHTAVVFYDAKSCYESGQLTDAQVVKANQVAYDADEHARNIEYSFDDEMKGDDFEDARFSIGDEVQPTVNHMPGMTKMVGKVVIVRDGNPPYYGIKFEGMEGIHKWYAEDELKAASDDDQTSSDREETSGKSNDETKYLDILSDGQREGSRFNDHSSRLLEANEEFMERVQSFMQSRAANRKSGRVLSADKHAQISEYRDGLQTIVESLSALLDEHDPNAESKSLDNEIEELEIGWMQQQLKLNDLLRKV